MEHQRAQACLVLGGSGAVGRFLLPRLRSSRCSLIAVSRHPVESADDGTRWLQGDLYGDMPDLGNEKITTIASVGPLDGLVDWLMRSDLPDLVRVVALSSMSVVVKAKSRDAQERAIADRLRQSEEALQAWCIDHSVDLVVLRPTLIYGAGIDRSLGALQRFGARWRMFPTIPAATGLRQPIHADDLAAACISAINVKGPFPKTYAVGGGEQLTFAAMLARTRQNLGVATVPVRVPLSFARLALRALRLLPRWHHLNDGLVDRLCVDQTADNGPATTDLDWQPRNLELPPHTRSSTSTRNP